MNEGQNDSMHDKMTVTAALPGRLCRGGRASGDRSCGGHPRTLAGANVGSLAALSHYEKELLQGGCRGGGGQPGQREGLSRGLATMARVSARKNAEGTGDFI